MKKALLLVVLIGSCLAGFTQADPTPPYKRFPGLPPLQLLLGDSTTKFTKENLAPGKPVLLFLFSPECSHCQQETEELVRRKEELKDIQLVMVTLYPLWQMNRFAEQYGVRQINGLVMGRDAFYTLPAFFDIRHLPFHALYNKEGKLITTFEGSADLDKILSVFAQ
jgi:thioredoxin-related protein